jgi:hypothetical protein
VPTLIKFVGLLLLLTALGCSIQKKKSDTDESGDATPVVAASQPRVLTDLSRLSAADTVAVPGAAATPAPVVSAEKTRPSTNEVVTHKMAAEAPSLRYNPEVTPSRGGVKLLNDKARQFANFSDLLLQQTLKAAEQAAPDKLENRRVPSDLKPVILTTVLDPQGRLNEIVIDQHSGDLLVDRWFIEACKKGIWSRNPPPAARASDGNYRLRLEGTVINASFDRYGIYSYETAVGLSIL